MAVTKRMLLACELEAHMSMSSCTILAVEC